MKRYLAFSALVAGLCQGAYADSGIRGTWKLEKQECSSGAPYGGFGPDIQIDFDIVATLTATELQIKIDSHIKYEKSYADTAIQKIQDAIARLQASPDSPEKSKSLSELNDALKMAHQYATGFSCTTTETDPYTLTGSVMHTGPATSHFSTCPGDSNEDANKSHDSTLELNGNALKIADMEPEAKDDGSCPKGDKLIATFVRVR